MPNLTRSVAPSLLLVAPALLGLAFGGCATVTRGVHEALVVESEPSGARVQLSTGDIGTTPTSFRVRRRGALDVTISKEGFETLHVHVSTQIAGWGAAGMAGNVLVGGVIGVGVDAFSGGTLEHKPNPIRVTLVPLPPSPPAVPAAPPAAEGFSPQPLPPPSPPVH